jgi:hypothetical protein
MNRFTLTNFGPIAHCDVAFGDLTILVGEQASGKSLFLEMLKLAVDRDSVIETLDRYNYILGHNTNKILDLYLGDGMAGLWKEDTEVALDDEPLTPRALPKKANPDKSDERMFYVPAQRILSIDDGRARNFMEFNNSAPYILRSFSETLRTFMQFGLGTGNNVVFPIKERLKDNQRNVFDKSIFHGAKAVMEERMGQRRMVLQVDGTTIPFMAWSAGQKEFMPLLLAFYALTGPPSKIVKKEKYKYVVIEEPEMGLHPKAILSVIMQILELISNGYKVIISTHSTVFLEFSWAFNMIKGNKARHIKALREIFSVPANSSMNKILKAVCDKKVNTFYFGRDAQTGKVTALDISSLNAFDDNPLIADWGGLSEFSSKVSDVVSKYAVDNE